MKYEYLIGGALFVTAVSALFAACSNKLKIREYEIKSGKISRPLTVAHISDLHECLYGEGQSKIAAALKESKPDLIFLTGDIVEDFETDSEEYRPLTENNNARTLFEAVSGIAPCFMVLGNHESNIPGTDMLCGEIESFGIRVLHRRNPEDADMCEEAVINGENILICGADDPYFDRLERKKRKKTVKERYLEDTDGKTPLINAWRERLRGEYANIGGESRLTLLLSHRPEEFELYKELSFDAAFSGHAHGGQWRLPPFINGVYAPHQGLFPRHAGGCYRYDGHTHIVSRGLSKKRMVRIFNRPEVCVVRFLPETDTDGKERS